jgi:hypothetical protein
MIPNDDGSGAPNPQLSGTHHRRRIQEGSLTLISDFHYVSKIAGMVISAVAKKSGIAGIKTWRAGAKLDCRQRG